MLNIKNLHVSINEKEILKGLNLEVNPGEVHAVMGPNGTGKSTLAAVIAGKEGYDITEGEISYLNKDLLELATEERALEGIFLGFQYPVEIPGVSMTNFMRTALNEHRKYKGLDPMSATDFLALMADKKKVVDIHDKLTNRSVNEGFSGGEKKRNEIFQMAMLEPLAIGSHAVERAEIKEDDIVLVIGAGPIGIGTISMALLKTNHVLALDMNTHRLEYVASRFPSVQTLAHSDDVADRLTAMLGGDLPTIIFDATGNKASMEKCFEYIAPAGTIVYIGLFIGDVTFHDPLFHKKEVTLKSSRNAVKDDFTKLINLFKTGKINIDGYITHRLSFDTIESSFTDLYDPDANVIKAVIDF